MSQANFEVIEGTDPVVTITLEDEYTLDGAPTITFYLKPTRATADGDASVVTYSGTIIDDGTGDLPASLQIEFARVDIASPGKMFYHLDVEKAGKKDVVGYGTITIIDV